MRPRHVPETVALRVLLDENVDRQIRDLFDAGVEISTVRERGWSGLTNGDLLRVASETLDVLVTMDRNLPYQQDLRSFDLGVVVIRAISNAFVDVAPLMPEVNEAVRSVKSGNAIVVAR